MIFAPGVFWIFDTINEIIGDTKTDTSPSLNYSDGYRDGYERGRLDAEKLLQSKADQLMNIISQLKATNMELEDENERLRSDLREWLDEYEVLKKSYDECKKALSAKTENSYVKIKRLWSDLTQAA